MSANCTCLPGTQANGWHEDRCAVCTAEEADIWRRMLQRLGLA